jgi:putative nucleotidyltransferase with HDIG domain
MEESGESLINKEKVEELKELLDSTYPLLQEFREACPGTYKHAQALSSMIEGVSMALGLDVDFMKVTALYHDVGKMFNPKYFTENQLEGENPHDDLDPWISSQILSRHVSDSVNILLNDPKFPREMIQIISQHHGDNVIKYFFDKAGSEEEDKEKFRYKCSKPVSVEAAVLMICDHVEAKSRSLVQAGKFESTDAIDATINDLIDDGQLDEVYMRLGDLKKIKEAVAKELEGMYQKRIDYDEAKEKPKRKRKVKEEESKEEENEE